MVRRTRFAVRIPRSSEGVAFPGVTERWHVSHEIRQPYPVRYVLVQDVSHQPHPMTVASVPLELWEKHFKWSRVEQLWRCDGEVTVQ